MFASWVCSLRAHITFITRHVIVDSRHVTVHTRRLTVSTSNQPTLVSGAHVLESQLPRRLQLLPPVPRRPSCSLGRIQASNSSFSSFSSSFSTLHAVSTLTRTLNRPPPINASLRLRSTPTSIPPVPLSDSASASASASFLPAVALPLRPQISPHPRCATPQVWPNERPVSSCHVRSAMVEPGRTSEADGMLGGSGGSGDGGGWEANKRIAHLQGVVGDSAVIKEAVTRLVRYIPPLLSPTSPFAPPRSANAASSLTSPPSFLSSFPPCSPASAPSPLSSSSSLIHTRALSSASSPSEPPKKVVAATLDGCSDPTTITISNGSSSSSSSSSSSRSNGSSNAGNLATPGPAILAAHPTPPAPPAGPSPPTSPSPTSPPSAPTPHRLSPEALALKQQQAAEARRAILQAEAEAEAAAAASGSAAAALDDTPMSSVAVPAFQTDPLSPNKQSVLGVALAAGGEAMGPMRRRKAAVLVALFEGEGGELRVWLTKRAAKLSSHSGEVALPGGKRDEGDADDSDTALREAEEEIGLHRSHARVVTHLEPFLSKHLLTVTPVVALLPRGFTFVPRPNADEVQAVFSVPLSLFLQPEHHRHEDHEWLGLPYRVHFFEYTAPPPPPHPLPNLSSAPHAPLASATTSTSQPFVSHTPPQPSMAASPAVLTGQGSSAVRRELREGAEEEQAGARVGAAEGDHFTIWGLTAAILVRVSCVVFGRSAPFGEFHPDAPNYATVLADLAKRQFLQL